MNKLNIGCGRDYRQGWENVDISKAVKAEAYLDIRKDQLPYMDESASQVYISGVLEQIGDNDQFLHAMNECHRVLTVGGQMTVVVPNARYAIASRDPMDIRKFTRETFAYFDSNSQEYSLYGSVYGFCPWSIEEIQENERHIFTVRLSKCALIK